MKLLRRSSRAVAASIEPVGDPLVALPPDQDADALVSVAVREDVGAVAVIDEAVTPLPVVAETVAPAPVAEELAPVIEEVVSVPVVKAPPAVLPRRRPAWLRAPRWVLTLLVWAVIGAVGGVAAATLAPPVAGYKVLTVFTGSMVPTLEVGSVVVDEEISPVLADQGDIVTFPDPNDNSRLLTHRIQSKRIGSTHVYFVTKGDANDTVERWNVPIADKLGRVVYTMPKVGYVREWLAGKQARLGLIGALGVFGLLVLWEVWRPERKPPVPPASAPSADGSH